MLVRKFFRVPKHQQFGYKPMHYDPRKEELEERLRTIKELQSGDIEGSKARIASGMRSRHKVDQTYRRQQVLRSNLILIGVLLMLAVLGYMMLNIYLPEFTKMISE
ncbi:MAG: hypothetical protein AAGJ82_07605 [Bacteroidota bacterium]